MHVKNLKLGTKLLVSFGFVCLIGTAVSAVGIHHMQQMNNAAELLYRNDLIGVSLTKEANIDLIYVGRAMRSALLASTEAERSKFLLEVDKNLDLTQQNLAKARPLFTSARGQAVFAELQAAWLGYAAGVKKMRTEVEGAKLNDRTAVTDQLFGDLAKLANRVDDQMSAATEVKEDNASKSLLSNTQAFHEARLLMIALVLAAAFVGLGIGLWIARGLTRQLGAEPRTATALAHAVASGDLSQPIELRAGDDSSLMAALHAMQISLAGVVSNVRGNAESVATASAQIAQGNLDLSQRAEEQAAALEETAASMEELSATVKQNADSAKVANQLAVSASSVATKGGAAVSQVVETMKGINDSSKKIADIISVIDGIAFQTNILALNAAVEAARAGEQGRGFAVVASEVRSLAQRSAEAAREIKRLINDSVERVEQGSSLVDSAGQTMAEVVASIVRVTDIIAEISSASAEQSAGVAQVGEAVMQMDQVTQQNAALVEQSAAAAASLTEQAQQLVQLVAVFKLADPAAPLRRSAGRAIG